LDFLRIYIDIKSGFNHFIKKKLYKRHYSKSRCPIIGPRSGSQTYRLSLSQIKPIRGYLETSFRLVNSTFES